MNNYYPLIVFAIATIVFHTIFVWVYPLSKIGWKYTEYVWLSLSVIGFVGLIKKTKIENSELLMVSESSFIKEYRRLTIDIIESSFYSSFCFESVKTEWSPKDFDERNAAAKAACHYSNEYLKYVETIRDTLTPIKMLAVEKFKDTYISKTMSEINKHIGDHNMRLAEYDSYRKNSTKDVWYVGIQNLFVWLLSIGIALRMTKATGEILLERRLTSHSKR